AELGNGRRRQRRCRAALERLAAAGERGLRDRVSLVGPLVHVRVDEDDFERRVLEHAVEAFGVDEAEGQKHRMHGERDADRDLQGAELAQVHEAVFWLSTAELSAVSFTSTAIAIGPATVSSSASSSSSPTAAPGRSSRSTIVPLTSSVIRSISPSLTRTRAPRGRSAPPSTG